MYCHAVAALTLLLAALSQARPMSDSDGGAPSKKFLHLPLSRDFDHSLSRRQVSTSLSNQIRTYMIDISVGSNAQKLTLSLDTGSAETFVNTASCTTCTGGIYDSSTSLGETVRPDLGSFEVNYIDGKKVSGEYISDDIAVGGNIVHNTTFAVSNNGMGNGYGIMGIGLPSAQPKYPNILDDMKTQGLISSRSYSLQLNSKHSTQGSIVFGGYDATNYAMISTLPLVSSGEGIPRLAIEWSGINVQASNGSTVYSQLNESRPVSLDSGFTLSTLPDNIFEEVSKSFDIRKSGSNYYVPCQQSDSHVELLFGGSATPITIQVPFSELAIPASLQTGGAQDQDLCMFGFRPVSAYGGLSSVVSFGDTFLRSACLMVNLDTNMIGLSQAVEGGGDCQSCIVAI